MQSSDARSVHRTDVGRWHVHNIQYKQFSLTLGSYTSHPITFQVITCTSTYSGDDENDDNDDDDNDDGNYDDNDDDDVVQLRIIIMVITMCLIRKYFVKRIRDS